METMSQVLGKTLTDLASACQPCPAVSSQLPLPQNDTTVVS